MSIQNVYQNHVGQTSTRMLEFPWEKRSAYAAFLAQTYYYTRHSTKLLSLAASRFSFEDYDLHRRFIAHTEEERGHEFMCEKDLSFLAYKATDFPELTITKAFYQRQYFLIEHLDPACFLGYVLALEGLSAMVAGKGKQKSRESLSREVQSIPARPL